jgi:beta-galactosidase
MGHKNIIFAYVLTLVPHITDANGVLVPNATNTVNFSVSGPGTIVGVDNGNSPTSEPYKANTRKAFSGKCLVIVQTTTAINVVKLTIMLTLLYFIKN